MHKQYTLNGEPRMATNQNYLNNPQLVQPINQQQIQPVIPVQQIMPQVYTKSVVPSVVPQVQSVVPSVVPTPTQAVIPVFDPTAQTTPTSQQFVLQQQMQPAAQATNNNDLTPVKDGLCQMLSERKIKLTMQKKREPLPKVGFPNVGFSESGLIGKLYTYTIPRDYHELYIKTEKLIAEYQTVLQNVYKTYIEKNIHNRALNNEFMSFSKTLTDNLFEVIKEYQKCYCFCNTPMNTDEFKNLFEENDEKYDLAGGQLEKNCKDARKKAKDLLIVKLQEFNNCAQRLIHDSANNLFSSNNQGDSVDDMAADDCVFGKDNISRLFPPTVFSDNTVKDAFWEKLSIDDGELNGDVNFICDISTFTNALLSAAESTFGEYLDPDSKQQQCVANCIKNAMTVATEGWKKYQILFKQMDDEHKEIVRDKYRKIFANIQQCMGKYNYYLQKARDESEDTRKKRKIENLMKKNENVKTSLKGFGMINNGVSMIGLNYKGIGKPASLETLFQ